MKYLSAFLLLIFLSGCQTTGFYIEDSNLPVPETRKVVAAIIGKPRIISLNGRELTSSFHDRKFEDLDETKKIKARYYTKVVILGPRRPYEISIQVTREVLDLETMTFVDQGIDESLTMKRAIEIKRALNKSLDTYQAVDAEEVF
ncbi:hypothetical protein [Pseudobdellovibrio sp. HCB154]|uniref:hypothetical protein n=1 Tax=Pseudobdellovibrio sp. HCB154 TaxID=3386277 RepID=UPI0039175D31